MSKNKIVCSLLRRSILELCKASIPEAEGVEVDGIVCISLGKNTEEQIVVKIHEVLWQTLSQADFARNDVTDFDITTEETYNQQRSDLKDNTLLNTVSFNPFSPKAKKPNKRKSSFPLPVIKRKQTRQDVESEFGDPIDSVEKSDSGILTPKNIKKEPVDIFKETALNVMSSGINNECNSLNESSIDESPNYKDGSDGFPAPICIKPSKLYVCDECKICFNTHSSYTHHMQVSQHGKVNSCQYCNRKFTNFNSFVFHMRSHGAPETTGDFWKGKPLRCGVCTVLLRSKRGILDHMRGEHNYVKCYTCTSCEEIYPDFNTFRSHRQQLHSTVNQCRCEMCELFFTFTEYKDHEKECVIKIFFDTIRSGSSPRRQTPLTDSGSVICNSNSNSSVENVTVVDETQPEVATVTPLSPTKSIATPSSYKNGNVVQTDHSPIISPMEGPFRCQSCFSVFQEFEQYETHNHEMHSRFVCSYCAQSFATRRNLQRHARRHTGVRPYQCLDCECNFTRDDDLKKHMFRLNHMTGYKLSHLKVVPHVSRNVPVQVANSVDSDDSSFIDLKEEKLNRKLKTEETSNMSCFPENDTDSENTSNSAYTLGALYEENVLSEEGIESNETNTSSKTQDHESQKENGNDMDASEPASELVLTINNNDDDNDDIA